jgi:hypothetical protein
MKQIIATTILGVWLLFELRDFFYNGGFSNSVAFGLLRICLVLVLMSLLLTANLIISVLPKIFKSVMKTERHELDQRFIEITRHAQNNFARNNIPNNTEPETQPATPTKPRLPTPLNLNAVRSAVKKRQTL